MYIISDNFIADANALNQIQMDFKTSGSLQQFQNHIGIPFQLYNSLFTSLPFHKIEKTGILLSLFIEHCAEGYEQQRTPEQIVDHFFEKHTSYRLPTEKFDLLFRFVQYVERQIVNGVGTLKHLQSEVIQNKAYRQLADKLKNFAVRIVLTAHPTQFYPSQVLGIIHDLSAALKLNQADKVNMYLQQLGKTAFLNKLRPTPYDEAVSLLWFLEHVFYESTGKLISFLRNGFPGINIEGKPVFSLGFWPGGDRDGNPNVTTDITLKVAAELRRSILKCYYDDIRRMKRRLTFKGTEQMLTDIEKQLYNILHENDDEPGITHSGLLETLHEVRVLLNTEHGGLFVSLVEDLISKVESFGFYFASLDIRQESSVHGTVIQEIISKGNALPEDYATHSEKEKMDLLATVSSPVEPAQFEGMVQDTLLSMAAVKTIQQKNGERGCNRYVISQCNSALNVMEVFGLFLMCGWHRDELSVDIVPLFETVDDLERAGTIMETLFNHAGYRAHVKRRNNTQTIMVGFSDGTKDGGYLMANWGIYKAKKALTAVGKKCNVDIIFFDGRGGPPARGGGKTHKFYASLGKEISNKEIQLTIQGQTISSAFGNHDAAQFNIEQLMTAGISNDIFSVKENSLTTGAEDLLKKIAEISLAKYLSLKNNPQLMDYLLKVSPIKYYSETNIGSRPANRKATSDFGLKDLRAIPYVGAWSQIKQNVTGYYGVGTALQAIEKEGRWDAFAALYQDSLFIKTLFDNCEMSMKKCFFPLTAGIANDPEFSDIWKDIYDEFELTKKYVLKLAGHKDLMDDYPVEQLSISMREKIMLPLITIQQHALSGLRKIAGDDDALKPVYEKLIIRCSFGIINAGRNSA
jgi:phosphoenolpyruvate carboxylase